MIRSIEQHKDQFGVEPVCQVSRPAVRGFITSRGYRAAVSRPASARQLRDELLVPEVTRLHAENYGVYGAARCMRCCAVRAGTSAGSRPNG